MLSRVVQAISPGSAEQWSRKEDAHNGPIRGLTVDGGCHRISCQRFGCRVGNWQFNCAGYVFRCASSHAERERPVRRVRYGSIVERVSCLIPAPQQECARASRAISDSNNYR